VKVETGESTKSKPYLAAAAAWADRNALSLAGEEAAVVLLAVEPLGLLAPLSLLLMPLLPK